MRLFSRQETLPNYVGKIGTILNLKAIGGKSRDCWNSLSVYLVFSKNKNCRSEKIT